MDSERQSSSERARTGIRSYFLDFMFKCKDYHDT